ncbi:hypothetical protein Glove_349g81 [Diversispora epigaea]|uniref:Uncharacterized protein n=1 Tax=Diversispora epigaea TaxID=1348612 RepID=A0A397HHZ7_9GLOM|nr:hypothetical protein Glove_349g81 [Diversispora epigaea]
MRIDNLWPGTDFYDNIQLILTVPAEWSEQKIYIMRECAFNASLIKNKDSTNLKFITETEAAAIYCMKIAKEFNIVVGKKYMIVDCGRDTVDLTTRGLLENGLGEITSGSGDFCGGSFVELEFLRFIESKVGTGAIELLKENHYCRYEYMIREFRDHVQISFTAEDTSFFHEFNLEYIFPILKDYTSGSFRDELEENEWVIELYYETVKSFFDPVIEKIIRLIHQLNANEPCSAIFLIGEFSESRYLQSRIRQSFKYLINNISVPSQPTCAIVRGATEYGLKEKAYTVTVNATNEINILLLGETGVGKSTFINSFANYLRYDTINDAQFGEMANHYCRYEYMIREFRDHVQISFTAEDTSFFHEFNLEYIFPILKDYTSGSFRDELEENEWVIELYYETVKSFFDPVIEKIIRLIHQLNANEPCSAIFLIGEFSESRYLQSRIRQSFKYLINNISVPSQPTCAIVRGATEYGLKEKAYTVTVNATNEINILLLGETGVGKSTFINSFANYLRYDTINDAQFGEMAVLIPSQFTIMDENFEANKIKIGDYDSNGQTGEEGMSATQGCKSYVFPVDNDTSVSLIDTPGIGDTRGIDKDKENFENILRHISHYKHLNGICILLKPNNARLSIVFKYCVQELLTHIHKGAKDNIVFCLTNARSTFYRPGDTLPTQQLNNLRERSGVEMKTDKNTMYCFDNESFRFLAALRENMKFSEESWRLFKHIVSLEPHRTEETLSLNNVRKNVMLLSKPLAEIGQLIQINISIIRDQQREIENTNQSIEDLRSRLYTTLLDLDPKKLDHPRTVCTSESCIKIITFGTNLMKRVDYIKHCHTRCYCVEPNVVYNAALRVCSAIKEDGNCRNCSCNWSKHMHITYENDYIPKKVVDANVEKQIKEKKSYQDLKKAIIKDKEQYINQQKCEQERISTINIKFAQFLGQNAIAAYSDTYSDYLDHFINVNEDNKILGELETVKREYSQKIAIIKRAIETNDLSMPQISLKEISHLEQELYKLPLNGQTLKRIKAEVERGRNATFRHEEKRCMRQGNKYWNNIFK